MVLRWRGLALAARTRTGRRLTATNTSTAQRSGFWTFEHLQARHDALVAAGEEGIISGFDPNKPERRERASYNLTVGEEIYISPSTPEETKSREMLKKRESRAIPPGQFAFLHTEETVNIPRDAIAFIALRSRATKFRGLVNVSGFYVEPGYKGNLVFAVFNAGPGEIQVARGDAWFEIFFADLVASTPEFRPKPGFKGVPNELITPLSNRFHSLPGLAAAIEEKSDELDERIQKLEREHSVLRWSLAIIVGALIAIGVRAFTDEIKESRSGTQSLGRPTAEASA